MSIRASVAVGAVAGMLLVSAGPQAGLKDLMQPLGDVMDKGLGGSLDSGGALSQQEMVAGLKEALSLGTERAIALLGKDGGFLNDNAVKIPLPGALSNVEKGLRAVGQEALAENFVASMNHAAEQAVPAAASIFGDTIKQMTLKDAQKILQGADDAATSYFREQSGERLAEAIRPIVQQATEKVGVTSAYKKMIGETGLLGGLLGGDTMDLDGYITDKALDGLFLKLAAEEKAIRENPVARSTELLQKVFGGN